MELITDKDFMQTLAQIERFAEVTQITQYMWVFEGKELRGKVIHKVLHGYEYRIWHWSLSGDITFVRKTWNSDVWNLNLVVGRGKVESSNPELKLDQGTLMNSELHNIKLDGTNTIKGPVELYSAAYFIDTSWLQQFATRLSKVSNVLSHSNSLAFYDVVSVDAQEQLKAILEWDITSPFHEEQVHSSAYKLLLLKLSKFWNRIESSDSVKINDVSIQRMLSAKSLFNDFHRPPTLEDISKYVGLNQTKTQQLFKQVYNKTPYQFFNEQRLQEAYELILNTDLQISEIGVRLGFASMSHFTQTFSKRFMILPKQLQLQSNVLNRNR